MHINNWVHASDLMKMVKSANSISTFSSEEGLPDNHVITIRERELTVDFPELIQNNVKTDTVTLELDAEWDGIQPVIIFGPNASGTIAVEYTGEPVHIPGAVMQYVGGLDCSVMGLDDSGEVRLVTKAAPNTFEVVESGEYIGQISEDDVSLLGQILSAIKDAETATSDASSAAEDATAAANSANTAAAKATNAANSANTAATKATAAANSANTASERAENAYDVLTPIIAEIGVNGNQPRATTNPNYIATATDAYAAKPLEICIKGETRQNLWVNNSVTAKGITVTSNDDGSVTLSGTSTSESDIYIQTSIYTVKPNTAYTLSIDKTPSGFSIYGQEYNGSTFFDSCVAIGADSTILYSTATTSKSGFDRMNIMFNVKAGVTVSGTYRIMLNEGATAQPWCPPGLNSVEELSLVTAGKNLLPPVSEWNASDNYHRYIENPFPIGTQLVGRYGGNPSGLIGNVRLEFRENYDSADYVAQITPWSATSTVGSAVTVTARDRYICIVTAESAGAYFDQMQLQLELGSTATAYEPPTVTQTPLPEVELRSLPNGTCDELVIGADGTCEVERKTQKVLFDGSDDEGWTKYQNANGLTIRAVLPYTHDGTVLNAAVCDKLPYVDNGFAKAIPSISVTSASSASDTIYVNLTGIAADVDSAVQWLKDNPITVVTTVSDTLTEPQSPVTLPTLPSPNITVYHDSDVPSDITVEYVQDINIVLDNLNAKIAALNVAQSISS